MSLENLTTYGGEIHPKLLRSAKAKSEKRFGLNFPTGEDTTNGYFSKVSGNRLLMNNLKQLLLTEKGERVMLPSYGVSIRKYLFEPFDEDTFMGIKDEVLSAIETYLPNARVLRFGVYGLDEADLHGSPQMRINLTVQDVSVDKTVEVGITLK
tara:strand:+ start:409 stop:867 length:459 start_codon:yes stop_codon:yes gene_type:complete